MKLLQLVLICATFVCCAAAQIPQPAESVNADNANAVQSPQHQVFRNALSDYRRHTAAIAQGFTFDTFQPTQPIGHYNFYEFKAPGFSWGNAGGWTVQHGIYEEGIFNTRGIGQMSVSTSVKHATGDFAAEYVYSSTDGGATAQSDEGFTLDTREGGETDSWFHGKVAAGATPGTTLLPVTYTAGPHSVKATTDGAFMLDLSKGTISGIVTGPDKLVEGTSVHTFPVSVKLPVSTGIGIVNTNIPRIKEADKPESIVLSGVHLLRGSFVAGKACLAGGWYPEQVVITSVRPASGGQQDVTIVHKNPNGLDKNNPTSLWQGGLCGQYLSLDRNLARNGFRTSYEVVGATDPEHLAYVWNVTGSTKQNVLKVYSSPVLLRNLVRKNGVVTASFTYANQPFIFNHAQDVVIADATDSSFNGTVHLPEYKDDLNVELKWSQSGPDSAAASATINMPTAYYGFHLYPGAEVLGPQVEGGVPLEPNSVDWAAGDTIENPHNPSFAMNGRMTELTQNTLSSGNNSNGFRRGFRGAGISGNYYPSIWTNDNPCSLYVGCGGTLEPIRWNTYGGPYSVLTKLGNAPLNQGTLFNVGCDIRGCDHKAPYRLFELQNGYMQYDPADGTFTVPHMAAASFRANEIDLNDPKSPDHVLRITSASIRVAIAAASEGKQGSNQVPGDPAAQIPAEASIVNGPANGNGSASCAKGYTCTATRGRITLMAAATTHAGIVAQVRTPLAPGSICTAVQNGGSRFFGIGGGKES
ncbi:MAG TPA: hypothetical protein VFE38_12190, partial [Edaphobacter sp.]|nr:hypothetical protein [Edaphobacter sp.]